MVAAIAPPVLVSLTAEQADALFEISGEGLAAFDAPISAFGRRQGPTWRAVCQARAALKAAVLGRPLPAVTGADLERSH